MRGRGTLEGWGQIRGIAALVGMFWGGILAPPLAEAADYLTILGTEEGRPDVPFQFFGFAQVVASGTMPSPITGLESEALAPYNGAYEAHSAYKGPDQLYGFRVQRARLAGRGSAPGTEQRLTWFMMFEAGTSAFTLDSPVVPTDISTTFSPHRGPNIRAGLFKPPTADEALEIVPTSQDTINFSSPMTQLVMERRITNGRPTGRSNAFRDTGVMVFDSHSVGSLEISWAGALSNGNIGGWDNNPNKDVSGRVQLAKLYDDKRLSPLRQEAAGFVWFQRGIRTIADEPDTLRLRTGAGLHLRKGGLRARGEVVYARGVIQAEAAIPVAGQPPSLLLNAEALGVTTLLAYQVTPKWELILAGDHLHQGLGEGDGDDRWSVGGRAGAVYVVSSHAQVRVNGEFTRWKAPYADAEIQHIYDQSAPSLGAQLTLRY